MKKSLSQEIVNGLGWTFAERFGAQIVSFIISVVLARLLSPNDYGVIAIVLIFINIANVFVVGGFGNSLIQKKDADELDFSTLFYFNIGFSLLIYLVVFFVSPYVERVYSYDGLATLMRVLGIRLLISGVNSIQRAYVSRSMQFKKFFFSTLGGTVLSAIVGIYMAYSGFGPWALVAQYLTNSITDTLVLSLTLRWRPQKKFSLSRLKLLVSYGWKLMFSSLLSQVYFELNELVVGTVYSGSDLAYYSRGKKFPELFVTNINSSVETVIFPALSKEQDDKYSMKIRINSIIKISTYLIFPIVFGLAAISNNLISVLLTDKWLESAKYLSISCISYALVPVGMANLQAIKAIGRSDTYLKLDLIKKGIGVSLLVIFLKHGVVAVAIAETITNVIGFLLNSVPNSKYINYSLTEQLKTVIPNLVISTIMFLTVSCINFLSINTVVKLIVQILAGIMMYIILSYLSKNSAFNDLLVLISNKKGK